MNPILLLISFIKSAVYFCKENVNDLNNWCRICGQVLWGSRQCNTAVLLKTVCSTFRIFHSLLWSKQSKALAWSKNNVLLEFPCFLYDPTDVGNLISGSSAFSKPSLYIWKFSVHVLLMPSLNEFEHYLASTWNEQKCMVEHRSKF